MDDPRVERLAEANSPDGKESELIAVWSDGTASSCVKTEGQRDVVCETFYFKAASKEDFTNLLSFVLRERKRKGWNVRVLHDPSGLDFLPQAESG